MNFFAAADGFSLLIFVGVIIASAIANWLKRKRGEADEETAAPPPPIRRERRETPAPSRAASWEEEIRRMLEGATAEPPPSPPPIVVAPPERPRPVTAPPPARPAPVVVARQRLPVPDIFSRAGQTEETESHEAHETEHRAELHESSSAYARASQLHEAVARRFAAVDHATVNARPAGVVDHRRHRTPEVEAVVGLLRQPHTARQLVIAQAVIGSPKALEA